MLARRLPARTIIAAIIGIVSVDDERFNTTEPGILQFAFTVGLSRELAL